MIIFGGVRSGHVVIVGACLLLLVRATPEAAAQARGDELRRLTLEQLLNVEVTTVSRSPETLLRTPAAVTVITGDDIRRSGVTTLVEALRLAPGVHVAQIDSNKWAVGIRGFGDRLSRAMLVLIDGRAVYSPFFAGTYWEVQDTMLEDVDRIEVIRGPGGTLWGANAVNGIVNIVTKRASETTGLLAAGGGGSEERGFLGVRYGGSRGAMAYRGYAKVADRDAAYHATGTDFDTWQFGQTGFRTDWSFGPGRDLTVQGDLYAGDLGQRLTVTTYTPPFSRAVDDRAGVSGGNVLARWTARTGPRSVLSLQAYFDRTRRVETAFSERRRTGDVDLQHNVTLGAHRVVWGVGARVTSDDSVAVPIREVVPPARTNRLLSAFAQDHVSIVRERLDLAIGARLERNDYTGVELQPSARLLWTPSRDQSVVLSATRAVRTPSRVEVDYYTGSVINPAVPFFLRLEPNDGFRSERMTAYEAGYRARPFSRLFVTTAVFLNQHQDTLSTWAGSAFAEAQPAPAHLVLPVRFENGLHGNSHGLEATAEIRATPWWRWTAAYSWLRVQLTRDRGAVDVSQERRAEGGSPQHQVLIGSSADLPGRVDLDWHFRYVSELPAVAVASYAASDVRVGWRPRERLELALVGRNLFDPRHFEFPGAAGAGAVEIQRSVHASATLRW